MEVKLRHLIASWAKQAPPTPRPVSHQHQTLCASNEPVSPEVSLCPQTNKEWQYKQISFILLEKRISATRYRGVFQHLHASVPCDYWIHLYVRSSSNKAMHDFPVVVKKFHSEFLGTCKWFLVCSWLNPADLIMTHLSHPAAASFDQSRFSLTLALLYPACTAVCV